MFCPRCGDVLEADPDGTLVCRRGEMPLSADMQKRLIEVFVSKSRRSLERVYSFEIGGTWCCPSCGVAAVEKQRGDLRCTSCDTSFAEFIWALVELHPHLRRD